MKDGDLFQIPDLFDGTDFVKVKLSCCHCRNGKIKMIMTTIVLAINGLDY